SCRYLHQPTARKVAPADVHVGMISQSHPPGHGSPGFVTARCVEALPDGAGNQIAVGLIVPTFHRPTYPGQRFLLTENADFLDECTYCSLIRDVELPRFTALVAVFDRPLAQRRDDAEAE